ncbi:Histidine kinase-, DNA gyrase B-, and HSP90-like ATPase [Paenibacillus sp. UNCCL117]|uniref:cache domain-containing sensor histidine kinase n=1 Tax=unclassified Paenibacillus TaxID=185978 RepID=UPI00088DD83C|nr:MULTISPECIES: sensor histidine kinase [unclassified Paenibacillus]SDE44757.1 Histidine kinase-, DNA gyrase B-, and HSP90-like ATPase [Paenibacillus sp. cl123]SFW46347.1 Histidine kinase-, DNA gyrase B-, and HSP90-like ATPase [Paenibacillus sp. UNCCL117]
MEKEFTKEKRRLSSWLPKTLKNRLFLAFVLLILLPHAFLNLYNFNRVEAVLRKQTADQNLDQMLSLNKSLEDFLNVAYKSVILIEQDDTASTVLQDPDRYDALQRVYLIETKFKSIMNSLFLSLSPVYYTIADYKGHAYASYQPYESLSYPRMTAEPWYVKATQQPGVYAWSWERNYTSRDVSRSPELLTYATSLKNRNNAPFAALRVSVDVYEWFRLATQFSQEKYLLLDPDGTVLADSKLRRPEQGDRLPGMPPLEDKGYYVSGSYLNIYAKLPRLDKVMIKQVPLDIMYAEVDRLKRSFFTVSVSLTLAFITITLLIASTITKPLHHLQRRMADAVDKRFRVKLPEGNRQGEVLQLTRAFNQMMGDMEDLVQRLKEEERKKEAVRFQVLLSQTNPHFLLNTLNTIKWLALGEKQPDIAEICVSLGKLLEAGLNSELELIHVREELRLVESYMYIQNFRYRQQFAVRYEAEPGLEYALIPKLSLQPLAENSIQHGFMELERQGIITVRVYARDGRLYLEVEDDGAGIKPEENGAAGAAGKPGRSRPGIGISNLRERLGLLFKGNSGLEVLPQPQGTLVRFYLPLLLSKPYEEAPAAVVQPPGEED